MQKAFADATSGSQASAAKLGLLDYDRTHLKKVEREDAYGVVEINDKSTYIFC